MTLYPYLSTHANFRYALVLYRLLLFEFGIAVLEVFILALEMLCNKNTLPIHEDSVKSCDSLNRRLNICLRDAIREWEKINNIDIVATPKSNLGKQPDLENEEVVKDYERTKPDFQWEFQNRLADENNHNNSFYKNYEIECKRLGKDISSRRNLSAEYVSKGIIRFTVDSHRYGQFASSGLMIGYVQSSDVQIILDEVNTAALSNSLPELLLLTKGWEQAISRLDHKLQRPDIEPSPFELRHLWVDLRHHYEQKITSAEKNESSSKKQKVQKPKSSKVKSNNE